MENDTDALLQCFKNCDPARQLEKLKDFKDEIERQRRTRPILTNPKTK